MLASPCGAVASEHPYTIALQVHPCTSSENATASSPEIAKVFDEQSADNRPPFQWCEGIDVDWLPNATILRFHTAIHVDYAYTYTLLRTKPGEGLSVTQFGEGLVGGNASPNLSDAIKAFNNLINSAQVPLGKAHAESACVLFLFVVGHEDHNGFFRHPERRRLVKISDYQPTFRTEAGKCVVSLRTRTTTWQFVFSSDKGKLSLVLCPRNT